MSLTLRLRESDIVPPHHGNLLPGNVLLFIIKLLFPGVDHKKIFDIYYWHHCFSVCLGLVVASLGLDTLVILTFYFMQLVKSGRG